MPGRKEKAGIFTTYKIWQTLVLKYKKPGMSWDTVLENLMQMAEEWKVYKKKELAGG